MKPRGSRSGQPLVALFVILGGWATARTAAWEFVGHAPAPVSSAAIAMAGQGGGRATGQTPAGQTMSFQKAAASRSVTTRLAGMAEAAQAPPHSEHSRRQPWADATVVRIAAPDGQPGVPIILPPSGPQRAPLPSASGAEGARMQTAIGHQLLWMAAVSRLPLPFRLADISQGTRAGAVGLPQPFYPVGHEPAVRANRWSADGWLMLRNGGNGRLPAGGAAASYGASQAGAVLRYRLVPGDAHRSAAYLRASAALDGSRDRELALGLSARLLPSVPVVAAAELRASGNRAGTRLRPAAMVVTEIAPIALPLASRLEAYGQAGYVGGRDATAFADGQLRVDRQVSRFRVAEVRTEVRAGVGAWAGAQKGASRVDVGPSLTLGVPAGQNGAMRLSMDWRFRVAGRAAPASGPALTLSAGF